MENLNSPSQVWQQIKWLLRQRVNPGKRIFPVEKEKRKEVKKKCIFRIEKCEGTEMKTKNFPSEQE